MIILFLIISILLSAKEKGVFDFLLSPLLIKFNSISIPISLFLEFLSTFFTSGTGGFSSFFSSFLFNCPSYFLIKGIIILSITSFHSFDSFNIFAIFVDIFIVLTSLFEFSFFKNSNSPKFNIFKLFFSSSVKVFNPAKTCNL